MRVKTTGSHLRGGCGLFGCGRLICMRCAMVTCFIWALLFFCILFRALLRLWYACLCAFLLLWRVRLYALASTLLFFFVAGFPSYASPPAVVSLSDSTASLFRLLEFAPRTPFFFIVFFVSLATRSFNACWALSNIIFGETWDAFWLPPCGTGSGRGGAGFSCFSIFIGLCSVGGAQSLSYTMRLPNSPSLSNVSSSFIAKSNGNSVAEGR